MTDSVNVYFSRQKRSFFAPVSDGSGPVSPLSRGLGPTPRPRSVWDPSSPRRDSGSSVRDCYDTPSDGRGADVLVDLQTRHDSPVQDQGPGGG